jgi:hypothetical protein
MTQTQLPHAISVQDLMQLGLQEVAYVKPVQIDGQSAVAVHAADGTQMAVMRSRESAFAAVRQNDLEPVSVH